MLRIQSYLVIVHLKLQQDPEEGCDVGGVSVHDDVVDTFLLDLPEHGAVVVRARLADVDLKVLSRRRPSTVKKFGRVLREKLAGLNLSGVT